MENKIREAFAGGIAGTAVITATMFLLSLIGVPDIDYGKLIARFSDSSVAVGWVIHFVIGTLLVFLYVYFFREFLPGPYWVKGTVFSVLPWVLTLILLFPMIETLGLSGETQSPGIFLISSMVAYFAFGVVVAIVAHPKGAKGSESFHVPASGH